MLLSSACVLRGVKNRMAKNYITNKNNDKKLLNNFLYLVIGALVLLIVCFCLIFKTINNQKMYNSWNKNHVWISRIHEPKLSKSMKKCVNDNNFTLINITEMACSDAFINDITKKNGSRDGRDVAEQLLVLGFKLNENPLLTPMSKEMIAAPNTDYSWENNLPKKVVISSADWKKIAKNNSY